MGDLQEWKNSICPPSDVSIPAQASLPMPEVSLERGTLLQQLVLPVCPSMGINTDLREGCCCVHRKKCGAYLAQSLEIK